MALPLGALAAVYLVYKCIQLAGHAGYDFKFLWVAGRLWVDGVSPYGPAYDAAGARLITEGHVPQIWAYPPNWWALCAGLALMPLKTAAVVWNVVGVGLTFASSALLVQAFRRAFPQALLVRNLLVRPLPLILVHVFMMAVLEATAIVLSTGQTAILVYFGVALLLFAMTRGSRALGIIALTLLFLKPHIGMAFGATLFVMGKEQRLQVLAAAAASALLSVPAFIIDPGVIGGFLSELARYDAAGDANLPQAMTGLRRLLWEAGGVDFPGIAAALAATALAVLLTAGPLRLARSGDPAIRAWQTVSLTSTVLMALAPLHYYDFTLVGVPALALLWVQRSYALVGALGIALMLRAKIIGEQFGLYDPAVPIYQGSLVATVSAIILLVGVVAAVRAWNHEDAAPRLTA